MTQIDPETFGEVKQMTVANSARIKKLEVKLDTIIWLLVGTLGGVIVNIATGVLQ